MQQTVTHRSSEVSQLKAPDASLTCWPLLVLIIPIGLFVASFFDRSSTVTKLTMPLTSAGQPVVSKPFQLPSVNDRVSISTEFSVPRDRVVFLSTELIDHQGVVQLHYDKEGIAPSSNSEFIAFRPSKAGLYRLRYEAYLPRDLQGQPANLNAPVVVKSVITNDPFDAGMLFSGFLASFIVSFLYLSRVYFRGTLQASGWCNSEAVARRLTRGEYRSGLLRVRLMARFEFSSQLYSPEFQAAKLEILNGSGRLVFQGIVPCRVTRDDEDSDVFTLRAEPQLFHLVQDSYLRFEMSLPTILTDRNPESVCIQTCDEIVLPWMKSVRARLNP